MDRGARQDTHQQCDLTNGSYSILRIETEFTKILLQVRQDGYCVEFSPASDSWESPKVHLNQSQSSSV